ncbi:unnamed protein product [Mycena citricolor]|uniref:Uncharacterized protein n=1 Tax=Mycena citricolor TaxID=2018698 RepID=A0AAD2HMZ3_9AGAR|nr:unnamed protein product [Mycena citricolor]
METPLAHLIHLCYGLETIKRTRRVDVNTDMSHLLPPGFPPIWESQCPPQHTEWEPYWPEMQSKLEAIYESPPATFYTTILTSCPGFQRVAVQFQSAPEEPLTQSVGGRLTSFHNSLNVPQLLNALSTLGYNVATLARRLGAAPRVNDYAAVKLAVFQSVFVLKTDFPPRCLDLFWGWWLSRYLEAYKGRLSRARDSIPRQINAIELHLAATKSTTAAYTCLVMLKSAVRLSHPLPVLMAELPALWSSPDIADPDTKIFTQLIRLCAQVATRLSSVAARMVHDAATDAALRVQPYFDHIESTLAEQDGNDEADSETDEIDMDVVKNEILAMLVTLDDPTVPLPQSTIATVLDGETALGISAWDDGTGDMGVEQWKHCNREETMLSLRSFGVGDQFRGLRTILTTRVGSVPMVPQWHQLQGLLAILTRTKSNGNEPTSVPSCVLLADDMGLGKTLTCMLTILVHAHLGSTGLPRYAQRHLVLCPPTLVAQWRDEIDLFLDGTLSTYVIGSVQEDWTAEIKMIHESPVPLHDQIVLTSHNVLTRMAAESIRLAPDGRCKPYPTGLWKKNSLYRWSFSTVVVDEAHNARNEGFLNRAIDAIIGLTQVGILCTGTPCVERLQDVVNLGLIMRAIEPSQKSMILVAVRNAHQAKRLVRDEENAQIARFSQLHHISQNKPTPLLQDVQRQDAAVIQTVRKLLKAQIIRRTGRSLDFNGVAIASTMPLHTVFCLQTPLTPTEIEDVAMLEADRDGKLERRGFEALGAFYLQARQAIALPVAARNDDLSIQSAAGLVFSKLSSLAELVIQLLSLGPEALVPASYHGTTGHVLAPEELNLPDVTTPIYQPSRFPDGKNAQCKILVYTMLASNQQAFQSYFASLGVKSLYLQGNQSLARREQVISQFKTDLSIPVLFVSSVGVAGLNLTEANVTITYDTPWSGVDAAQFHARAFRTGQQRHCFGIMLFAPYTVDVYLLMTALGKADLAVTFSTPEKARAVVEQLHAEDANDGRTVAETETETKQADSLPLAKKATQPAKNQTQSKGRKGLGSLLPAEASIEQAPPTHPPATAPIPSPHGHPDPLPPHLPPASPITHLTQQLGSEAPHTETPQHQQQDSLSDPPEGTPTGPDASAPSNTSDKDLPAQITQTESEPPAEQPGKAQHVTDSESNSQPRHIPVDSPARPLSNDIEMTDVDHSSGHPVPAEKRIAPLEDQEPPDASQSGSFEDFRSDQDSVLYDDHEWPPSSQSGSVDDFRSDHDSTSRDHSEWPPSSQAGSSQPTQTDSEPSSSQQVQTRPARKRKRALPEREPSVEPIDEAPLMFKPQVRAKKNAMQRLRQ